MGGKDCSVEIFDVLLFCGLFRLVYLGCLGGFFVCLFALVGYFLVCVAWWLFGFCFSLENNLLCVGAY